MRPDGNDRKNQELVAGYEALRRGWLDQGITEMRGLALFFRRGMSAWMDAWREGVLAREDRRRGSAEEILPYGGQADTVQMVAEMTMNVLPEIGT